MNESDAGDFVERLGAMTVKAQLDHSEKIARGILDYPDDPRRADAEKILECVEQARRALKRGWDVAGVMDNLHRLSDAANWEIIGPHVERGAKILTSAKEGHEAVYGTDQEKATQRQAMYSDYLDALSKGNNKTGARSLVAEQHGVSTKTVQRVIKRISEET